MGRIQVGADYTQIEKRQEAILQMLALCPRNGEVEVGDSDDIIAAQAVKKILLKHPYIAVISWDRGGKVSVGYAEGLAASMSAGTLQELQAASQIVGLEKVEAVFARAFLAKAPKEASREDRDAKLLIDTAKVLTPFRGKR